MPEMTFPALEGTMGDRHFYMAVLTLQEVAMLFEPTAPSLPAELRAQRPLQEKRIPEIAQYLLEREADWVFASITVSFDGELEFSERSQKLTLSSDTEFVIVDGQHRVAAIKRAIAEDPVLRKQQIGVMLISFEDLERNQQIFSDLNRTVQKTSRSLDILYDHVDPLNGIVKAVAARVPLFEGRVEKNQTSLAARSRHFITLSSLYDACEQLLGGPNAFSGSPSDEDLQFAEDICVNFWERLSSTISPWAMVKSGQIKPSEARTEYIVTHAVAFWAVSSAASLVLGLRGRESWRSPIEWDLLDGFATVNWHKANPDWQGIAMLGPAVVTRRQTRVALSRRLCHILAPDRFEDAPRVLLVE